MVRILDSGQRNFPGAFPIIVERNKTEEFPFCVRVEEGALLGV